MSKIKYHLPHKWPQDEPDTSLFAALKTLQPQPKATKKIEAKNR